MPTVPLPDLESELIACGRIVQDNDASVSVEEAEHRFNRFNRYVELVDSIRGTEDVRTARALLSSMQAVHDYGAYQAALGKLVFGFPPSVVSEAVVAEAPRLIIELPQWAGEVLNMLVQAQGKSEELVLAFNSKLAHAPAAEREAIIRFIRAQEREGWLEHKPGLLAT